MTTSQEEINAWRAQAEYYNKQAERLGRSSWPDFTQIVTLSAAFIAAFVALFSLKKTLEADRNKTADVQLYEALKRLGDQDSPMVRASAGGMLLPACGKYEAKYYIAQEQLATALLLETDSIVVMPMMNAFIDLFSLDAASCYKALYNQNLQLQRNLVRALSRFFVANGHNDAKLIPNKLWIKAEQVSRYPSGVLQGLVARTMKSGYSEHHIRPDFNLL